MIADASLRWSALPAQFRQTGLEPFPLAEPNVKLRIPAEQEAQTLREALTKTQGNVTKAAQLLGISRATFWRKRKQYGI
jgi:transcriptional regulator of acetoin/glycerol metabolism